MSDSTEPDADAWAEACAEDLAAERSRRREQYGSTEGSAASELGRLVDSVADRIAEFAAPLAGAAGESAGRRAAESAAEQWARQLAEGAKSVLGPVAERNPQVLEHLAAAGSELMSAYRAAVSDQEQRWTKRSTTAEEREVTVIRDDAPAPREAAEDPAAETTRTSGDSRDGDNDGDDPPGTERIDLD